MIIIGNAKVLSRDKLWNNLLFHFSELDLLVEGNMPTLKTCQLKFKAPEKYNAERRNMMG